MYEGKLYVPIFDEVSAIYAFSGFAVVCTTDSVGAHCGSGSTTPANAALPLLELARLFVRIRQVVGGALRLRAGLSSGT